MTHQFLRTVSRAVVRSGVRRLRRELAADADLEALSGGAAGFVAGVGVEAVTARERWAAISRATWIGVPAASWFEMNEWRKSWLRSSG